MTITDRLGAADIRLVPCQATNTAAEVAQLFFNHWYCENRLPLKIITDRDRLFMSHFWKELHKIMGVKLKMSSTYHLETDGATERTNKTVNQMLRFHVNRQQKG